MMSPRHRSISPSSRRLELQSANLLDLSVIAEQAVDKIAEALAFDAVWIYGLEPRTKMLRMIACHGRAKLVRDDGICQSVNGLIRLVFAFVGSVPA